MKQFLKENSSIILTVGAGAGVVATAYLAARGGYKHGVDLQNRDPYAELDWKEETKRVWKLYVPAGAAGAATIVCLAGVKRVDGKKTLAAQAALAVSQRAYESYREEVVAEYGERKDSELLARGAQKQVDEAKTPTLVVGSGDVMCFDMFSGRYFKSDMQKLKRAENEVNAKVLKHDYATLDDFYYEIGLEYTTSSGQVGWKDGRLMELEFSSVIHQGEPCLAFEFTYLRPL